MITILDYGINNLSSVSKAVGHLGFEHRVATNLSGATKLIIPGVGAFGAAMERLTPQADDIRAFAREGNPVLGICLGMQLLFERSEELGEFEGLGLIPGCVRYIPTAPGLKVPNIGWCPVQFASRSKLGEGIGPGEQMYFVHSLVAHPASLSDIAATSVHGEPFAAAVERGNVSGTQFHPEKSGDVGLQLLANFLRC